jgi:hypothetical protein
MPVLSARYSTFPALNSPIACVINQDKLWGVDEQQELWKILIKSKLLQHLWTATWHSPLLSFIESSSPDGYRTHPSTSPILNAY